MRGGVALGPTALRQSPASQLAPTGQILPFCTGTKQASWRRPRAFFLTPAFFMGQYDPDRMQAPTYLISVLAEHIQVLDVKINPGTQAAFTSEGGACFESSLGIKQLERILST